jgi:DNA-directed RNA polymerase specialized sigma24 family protein
MPSERNAEADALGDRALVVAIRCGSAAAVREFVWRYRPMLLLAARRLGLLDDERADIVDEVLHDTAIHLSDAAAPVPLAVRGYLLRSLRNRITNARRARERRSRATTAATDAACDAEPYFEHAVVGCASEHSVRASHGLAWDGPCPVAPGLLRLVGLLTSTLSVEDRALIEWLSYHVPQQEIAAWLGLGYEATSKRVRRLRARLQAAAIRHIEHLSADERREVLTFLRRAAGPEAHTQGASTARPDPTACRTPSTVRGQK